MKYDEIKDMPLAEALIRLSLASLVQAMRHTYRPFFAAAISQAATNHFKEPLKKCRDFRFKLSNG